MNATPVQLIDALIKYHTSRARPPAAATPVQIIDALIKYLYNVSPVKVFEAVYGTGHHSTYRDEKLNAMKNLSRWWGELDNEHRARLVNLALERYNLV